MHHALMATRHPERYRKLLRRLRRARREADMTQVEAARALGVTQQFLSRTETGDRRLDPVELEEFARIYSKPIGFFLGSKDE